MKALQKLLLSSIIMSGILPWNATAIDKSNFIASLGTNTFASNYIESLMVKSLLEVTQGKISEAENTLDQVIKSAPNFKLAYLVRGDLLLAQAQEIKSFGNTSTPEAVADFRDEAISRISRYLSNKVQSQVPEVIWQLDNSQKYAILVDADKSRLYLYKNNNGQAEYVSDYYATLGKNGSEKISEGDKRTPLGVYTAANKLNQKLPDMYGDAAFPLSYPNEIDKHEGRNGHGIWLHGTPSNTYSRPPRASDGCVVLSNPDLKSLAPILQSGNTPVIIARNIKWLDIGDTSDTKLELQNSLDNWRKDWESQNTDKYIEHYSKRFFNSNNNYDTWSQEKRRIQANKMKVSVKISNVSLFRYPSSQSEMAVATFDQDYKSDNLDSKMRKRQYWIHENNQWKILYEGAV